MEATVLLLAIGAWHADPGTSGGPSGSNATETLVERQARIARGYREFEGMLHRAADEWSSTDPAIADLLARAYAQSKRDLISLRFDRLANQLKETDDEQWTTGQDELRTPLRRLLELLNSRDRARKLLERRQKWEQLHRDAGRIRSRQEAVWGSTRRVAGRGAEDAQIADLAEIRDRQRQLADDTESWNSKSSSQGPSEGAAPEPVDEPTASPASSDEDLPGQKDLALAHRAIRSAADRIDGRQLPLANQDQRSAIDHLDRALDAFENRLRQAREEEREQVLASLQSRCQRIVEQQKTILEGTLRLDEIPAARRTRVEAKQSSDLGSLERKIVHELEQMLVVLREDGTALAFPEAVRQMIADARLVADQLERGETDSENQRLQQSILGQANELLAALEQQRHSRRSNAKGTGQAGGDSASLVSTLAELKLLRSLQRRIHERTRDALEQPRLDPQGNRSRDLLSELSDRQARVVEIARRLAKESAP